MDAKYQMCVATHTPLPLICCCTIMSIHKHLFGIIVYYHGLYLNPISMQNSPHRFILRTTQGSSVLTIKVTISSVDFPITGTPLISINSSPSRNISIYSTTYNYMSAGSFCYTLNSPLASASQPLSSFPKNTESSCL